MDIKRSGSQSSGKGPADWFTGTVRIDPLNSPPEPARVGMALVTFEPGARTAWHTHPLGQTLVVTTGCGRVQREGGPIEEIRPGDVIWFEPGEKHWHGAAPTTAISHIAICSGCAAPAPAWCWAWHCRSTAGWWPTEALGMPVQASFVTVGASQGWQVLAVLSTLMASISTDLFLHSLILELSGRRLW